MKISEPKTKKDFEEYYDLRWRVLREPWGQPKGSEKDSLEDKSIHIMAVEGNQVIGCGRLHFNSPEEAQIRYMAVEEDMRGKGVGSRILTGLEKKAKKKKAKRIVLNARESAVKFYENNGYIVTGEGHKLFGEIEHKRMKKEL